MIILTTLRYLKFIFRFKATMYLVFMVFSPYLCYATFYCVYAQSELFSIANQPQNSPNLIFCSIKMGLIYNDFGWTMGSRSVGALPSILTCYLISISQKWRQLYLHIMIFFLFYYNHGSITHNIYVSWAVNKSLIQAVFYLNLGWKDFVIFWLRALLTQS